MNTGTPHLNGTKISILIESWEYDKTMCQRVLIPNPQGVRTRAHIQVVRCNKIKWK